MQTLRAMERQMDEVLVRKVYLEGRPLVGLSRKEQRKRKKAGLRQFFDCFCL